MCAGNSSFMRAKSSAIKDHPRVCGEQDYLPLASASQRGSPPRVRGTAGLCDCVAQAWGITPACAGNSSQPCHHM